MRADGELRVYDLPAMTEACGASDSGSSRTTGSMPARWLSPEMVDDSPSCARHGEPSGYTTWHAGTWFTSCRSRPRGRSAG